jgi:DNA repair exonuclease SbcCD ATPase subunit
MAKTIALSIEIDGLSDLTKQVVGLEQELKSLNSELKGVEVGSDEYIKLRNQIAATKEELSKAKKEQKDFLKSASATQEAEGSYYQLNQQLVDLKKQYKSLSAAERDSAKGQELKTKIQQLDAELKDIDGSIGQFQRNVGNYPKTFAMINRSLTRAIPGFEAFSEQLKDGEGRLNGFGKALIGGFIAFQGAKLIGQAIKSLDEFNKKIKETQDTVATFSGAYGADLDNLTAQTKALADTFDTDAKTISEAAQALSKSMGISFEDALNSIEKTLVEGRGDVGLYLEKVKEFPESFIAAGEAVSDVAIQNEKVLATNKELAISQVQIAKQTQALGQNFKVISDVVKTAFLAVLMRLIDIFKPLFLAIYDMGVALFGLQKAFLGIFTGGNEAVSLIDIFTTAIKLLIAPVQVAINVITAIVNALKPLVPLMQFAAAAIIGYRVAMVASTIATNAQRIALIAYNTAIKLFTAFTNGAKLATQAFNAAMKASPIGLIIAGATAAAAALYTMSESTDEETKKLEALAEAEKKAADAAQERTDVFQERIRAIEKSYQEEKKALDLRNADGLISEEEFSEKSVEINTKRVQALIDLNNKQLAENQRLSAMNIKVTEGENEAIKQQLQQLIIEQNQLEVQQRKIAADRRKKAEEAAKKLAEDRKKYGEEEIKEARARAALLLDLQTKLQEEVIKNIKDNQQREIKEAEMNAQSQVAALRKQYDDLVIAATEREKELAKVFGQNSAEVVNTKKENAKQLEEVSKQQAQIEIQIQINLNNQLTVINDTYRKAELDKAEENLQQLKEWRDEALTSELDYIDEVQRMRLLKSEETLNKQLALEKDAKKKEELIRLAEEKRILDEIEKIKVQQRAVDDQEAFLKEQAANGVQIRQDEFDAVAKARQELNTKLSEAELQYVNIVQKTSDDLKKKRLEDIEEIAGYVQQGLELLETVLSGISARAEKNIEEQLQRSSERQDELNQELEGATGLRRQFIQQQIDAEIQNEEKLAKKQEEIQRAAAKREKAIAVTQSIIQGFLAVSKAVASAPPPLNIPAIVTASLQAAIQTAGILAQPLAEGGAVVPVGLPDSGGKVVGVQNIPQTSKGDNVLVAARVGETFLNAKQTKLLRPVLSAAKIPGFANGGMLGAPNLGALDNGLMRAFNERTNAISGQVMESKVYLVTDELKRDTAEGDRIKRKVILR